jgi:hypothetical protein
MEHGRRQMEKMGGVSGSLATLVRFSLTQSLSFKKKESKTMIRSALGPTDHQSAKASRDRTHSSIPHGIGSDDRLKPVS